jgi:hypothetical protein
MLQQEDERKTEEPPIAAALQVAMPNSGGSPLLLDP